MVLPGGRRGAGTFEAQPSTAVVTAALANFSQSPTHPGEGNAPLQPALVFLSHPKGKGTETHTRKSRSRGARPLKAQPTHRTANTAPPYPATSPKYYLQQLLLPRMSGLATNKTKQKNTRHTKRQKHSWKTQSQHQNETCGRDVGVLSPGIYSNCDSTIHMLGLPWAKQTTRRNRRAVCVERWRLRTGRKW